MVFLGWRSGALSQAIRIGAAVAVVFASPFVAVIVREALFRHSGMAAPMTEMGALFLAGVLIYVAIVLAGWLVVKTMRAASKTLSGLDRAGGALIGGFKAIIIIYFIVILVAMVEVPLEKHDPTNALHLREGHATAVVTRFNVLSPWQFPDLRVLHDALRVGHLAEQSGNKGLLREHARAADLLRKKAVNELLEDEELIEAMVADHYPVTLADERVRALLNDGEFVTQLRSVDWQALLTVAAGAEDPGGAP